MLNFCYYIKEYLKNLKFKLKIKINFVLIETKIYTEHVQKYYIEKFITR